MRRIAFFLLLGAAVFAAPATAGGGLRGLWKGKFHVVVDGKRYTDPMVLRITALKPGEKGGSVRYPGYACHGPLTVLSHDGARASFRYHERSTGDCTGDDRINVRLRPDGLHVRIIPGEPGKAPGTATLSRRG